VGAYITQKVLNATFGGATISIPPGTKLQNVRLPSAVSLTEDPEGFALSYTDPVRFVCDGKECECDMATFAVAAYAA
jgi:hypothetical protein